MNNILQYFIILILPGGWFIAGAYKLYTMFIQKRSHDTKEIDYLLSDYLMYKHGRRNKGYVGTFIKLTDDVSCVKFDEDNNLTREFKC